jgi:hypothetical protein
MGILAPAAATAATTERVVSGWLTGLAIDGFDPVAYFVDGAATKGRAECELYFAGVTWLFRNEGNRAAFVARPDIYMPRYGGYDPVDVARGVARAGNPDFWLVVGTRLYLFSTPESRDAFALAPAKSIEAAEAAWPAVYARLSP